MSVVRVIKNKDYTAMGNFHLKEKEMSLKAIGLLSIMLSLPDNWDYSVSGLTSIRKESYDTIRAILKELEEFGYLNRTQIKNEKGKFIDVEYTIYEKPIPKNPITENPLTENYRQLNTNIINNLNNKILKNKYGEYQNVLLSENELKRLSSTYPNYEELINFLDEYIESLEPKKKKAYLKKNHNLCIKRWVVDAVEERKKEKKQNKKEIEDEYENYWKEKLNEEK